MSAPFYQDDLVTLWHADCLEQTEWLTADVLITDPPYGMSYESNFNRIKGTQKVGRPVAGDDTPDIRDRALVAWGNKPALVFGRWNVARPFATRHRLIWDKGLGPGMGDLSMPWGNGEEEIYVLGKGFAGIRGTIADPFAGSGATLLAARNLGRQVIGVELEEKYCELIAKRLCQQAFDLGALA
jgi:DNA modification methylase